MIYHKFNMSLGEVIARFTENGSLEGLWFINQKYFPELDDDVLWYEHNKTSNIKHQVLELERQLLAYDQGHLKVFNLQLSPKGTPFQEIVWKILLDIKYGQTLTYGDISRKVAKIMDRSSMSAQAVGSAVGHNPISIIIPCHRVIGKDGTLTGFAGGLDKKKRLLELEGHVYEEQLTLDL